jgi:hypothetical protein
MKRLLSELQASTPFVNSDFWDVLQNQHTMAYSGYLEGINKYNDVKNRGIILTGCELTSLTPLNTPNKFDWTFNMSNSLIYFDGQYHDWTKTQTVLSVSNASKVYFYPRYLTQSRSFRDGQTKEMICDYTFDYITDTAPSGPYVLFEWGGTARNLSRLIKLSNTTEDDILMDYDVVKYQVPSNWQYGDNQLWRDYDNKNLKSSNFNIDGRNELEGFRIFTPMSGRFPVGYSQSAPISPAAAGLKESNYGTPSNIGGTNSVALELIETVPHNHAPLPKIGGLYFQALSPYTQIRAKNTNPPTANFAQTFQVGQILYYVKQDGTYLQLGTIVSFGNGTPYSDRSYVNLQVSIELTKVTTMNSEYAGGYYGELVTSSGGSNLNVDSSKTQQSLNHKHQTWLFNEQYLNYDVSISQPSNIDRTPYPDNYRNSKLQYRRLMTAGAPVSSADTNYPPVQGESTGGKFYTYTDALDGHFGDGDGGVRRSLQHTHTATPVGDGVAHENRPPYLVTIFYKKI